MNPKLSHLYRVLVRSNPPKYPDLENFYLVTKWRSDRQLWRMDDKMINKIVEAEIEEKNLSDLNEKVDFDKFENVRLVKDYDVSSPIWKGEVKIPEHLRPETKA